MASDTFTESVNQFDEATVIQPPGEPTPAFTVKRDVAGTGGVLVLKDGYALQALKGPQEGVRNHGLQDLTSLAQWILKHVPETDHDGVEVFVAESIAIAIIDARHHELAEQISGAMEAHPIFSLWLGVLAQDGSGRWIDQRELFRHVRKVVGTIESGSILLQKVQKAGVMEGMDTALEFSDTGTTTLRGATARQDSTLEIPDVLSVDLPVYLTTQGHYTEPVRYHLDVIVETEISEGSISFRLCAPGLIELRRKAQRDAATTLQTLLGEAFRVVLGAPALEHRSRLADVPA